jgi:PAS domain S-box
MRMQKKLFLSYILIGIVAILISTFSFWNKGYTYIDKQSKDYYLLQAKLLADNFQKTDPETSKDYHDFVNSYGKEYNVRITIISQNGDVYADSAKDKKLENHKTREEVEMALKGESVSVNRYSKTMKQMYSYSAVPVTSKDFKGVLRVSLPLSERESLDNRLFQSITLSVILCFLIALMIAAILTKVVSNPLVEITKAAKRISEGDYNSVIYTREEGQIGKLASAFNIMSENLKNSIKTLKDQNIELEAMLGSMTSGVVALDNDNMILFHNKEFMNLVGTQKETLTGEAFYHEVRNALIFEAIDSVRKSGENEVKEGYFSISPTEGEKIIRVTATQLTDHSEKVLGILLIIEDITQIRKLENVRSDFVSNVTHELKTPLTSIRGFIDTLKNGAINDEKVARKFLDIIDIESERLSKLIQDILLLSEIESKRDYEVLTYNVDESIKSVIELLQPKLTGQVKIEYTPEPYVRPFTCNPDRMKELVINLLDNAIKYTEKGTITIECREDENDLLLRISDTGIGMEKQHLSRIFERFYRVDKGRSRKNGGTGLGLSIVKHIVELYSGKIRVESEIGVGTVFEIRLPY